MNLNVEGAGRANIFLGVAFHAAAAIFGGFALGFALALGTEALARGEAGDVRALAELLPFVVSGALLAVFTTPRWFSRSAPWVGLLGLVPLFIGARELWFGWSPTWSHEARSDYVLSQLFGMPNGCSDSECLYMLLFTFPFVCLTAYSMTALITLRFFRRQLA